MATLVGTQLSGRYRLDEKIGAGGMSTVYRALDMTLERDVAVKIMHREIAADSDHLERFRREARAVAQLSHPHIVNVIDAGEDQGRPYIVFEYVEGETLKDRIRRMGRLPVAEAVAYAIEIARALGYAHQRHIVHRDVKPQNVLIDAEGSAKVTDFGIARTLDQEGLTADGRVLGTTDYVSPEQALGHKVTGQSDLYSLGIVLFEMLAGEVPFRGENQVAVAMKHVRDALPDVQRLRPEVSSALAAVLDGATAKDLDRRYADDLELIADLEDVLAIETARAGGATGEATAVLRTLPARAQRRLPLRLRRPGWLAAGVLLAVIAAAGVIVALSQNTHRGTGTSGAKPVKGLQAIPLKQNGASDFDPLGIPQSENPAQADFAIDRNPATTWNTESYGPGAQLPKAGVGIYVDADPGVAAKLMQVDTPETGWTAEVFASDRQPSRASTDPPERDSSFHLVAGPRKITEQTVKIPLDTAGHPYRYYLLWITRLPPSGQAKVAEIFLFS
ncbi:MAG TPA: protein kinase [Solirubrobacteraceae bacterium]|jgi:serine/threonine-protein kinase|nr:protein kinase [Solirubrobacteraceae bacterium]